MTTVDDFTITFTSGKVETVRGVTKSWIDDHVLHLYGREDAMSPVTHLGSFPTVNIRKWRALLR